MAASICPECGNGVSDGMRFCPSCGAPLLEKAPIIEPADSEADSTNVDEREVENPECAIAEQNPSRESDDESADNAASNPEGDIAECGDASGEPADSPHGECEADTDSRENAQSGNAAAEKHGEDEEMPVDEDETTDAQDDQRHGFSGVSASAPDVKASYSDVKSKLANKKPHVSKKIVAVAAVIVVALVCFGAYQSLWAIPNAKYEDAKSLLNSGQTNDAKVAFDGLDGFQDSSTYSRECEAIALYDDCKYAQANTIFKELGDFDQASSYVEKIPEESVVAYLSAKAKESLKDPDSFDLREAWLPSNGSQAVLKVGGKNSYGGVVSNLDYFSYKDGEWKLVDGYSDLEHETYSRYTSSSRKAEIIVDNAIKDMISDVISGKSVDDSVVERVNQLNENGKLKVSSIEIVGNMAGSASA